MDTVYVCPCEGSKLVVVYIYIYDSAEREIAAHLNTRARGGMAGGGKRALLVGVSYKDDSKSKLTGSAKDVKSMYDLLRDRFDFPKEFIHMLTGN